MAPESLEPSTEGSKQDRFLPAKYAKKRERVSVFRGGGAVWRVSRATSESEMFCVPFANQTVPGRKGAGIACFQSLENRPGKFPGIGNFSSKGRKNPLNKVPMIGRCED